MHNKYNKTVLIIDDDPLVRRAAKRILTNAGFVVAEVASATKAKQYFVPQVPPRIESQPLPEKEPEPRLVIDLVLCDEDMPELSGFQLHQEVAAVLGKYGVAFIFMTGGTIKPEAEPYYAQTGVPVIRKPFSRDNLVKMVSDRLRP